MEYQPVRSGGMAASSGAPQAQYGAVPQQQTMQYQYQQPQLMPQFAVVPTQFPGSGPLQLKFNAPCCGEINWKITGGPSTIQIRPAPKLGGGCFKDPEWAEWLVQNEATAANIYNIRQRSPQCCDSGKNTQGEFEFQVINSKLETMSRILIPGPSCCGGGKRDFRVVCPPTQMERKQGQTTNQIYYIAGEKKSCSNSYELVVYRGGNGSQNGRNNVVATILVGSSNCCSTPSYTLQPVNNNPNVSLDDDVKFTLLWGSVVNASINSESGGGGRTIGGIISLIFVIVLWVVILGLKIGFRS